MSVLKPRTRVVYFRISEEEFGRLNQLCKAQGARSLSDLARTAVQGMLGSTGAQGVPPDTVVTKLEGLERALAELNDAIRTMSKKSE